MQLLISFAILCNVLGRRGTPGRWSNPQTWGNPRVHIISHYMLGGVTRHMLPHLSGVPHLQVNRQKYRLVILDPIKHVLGVYWTTSKTFLLKRVSVELITMTLTWTLEISIPEKYEIIMQENHISHVFRNFPVYDSNRRDGVLFQSFSEA